VRGRLADKGANLPGTPRPGRRDKRSGNRRLRANTPAGPAVRLPRHPLRRLDFEIPATVKGLTEAGFFRLCRPHGLGGLEADPITVLHVVEEIARHDGSAAWCALNCSIPGVLQSFLAQEGTREIGSALDLVVNGIIAPSGRALEVEGGYRVTDFAQHALPLP
jgi:alkylation response protein AidB-like acyl-CoA dehydrogenase